MNYPKLTRTTRIRLVLIGLGLLGLWVWYPSVRDVPEPSPTPCWDLNAHLEDVVVTMAKQGVEIKLVPFNCAQSGRFVFQDIV